MFQSELLNKLGTPVFMSGVEQGNQAFRWSHQPALVRENRTRFLGILRTLGHWPLFMLGNGILMNGWLKPDEPEIVVVTRREKGSGMYWTKDERFPQTLTMSIPDVIRAEALLTQERGVFLAALVADCPTAVIIEPELPVLALVHLSRETTKSRLLARVIQYLQDKFLVLPQQLFAVIGPGIQPESYQFPAKEFEKCFAGIGREEWEPFFSPGERDGSLAVDLSGYNRALLLGAGIPTDQIGVSRLDTFASRDPAEPIRHQFFSHRRSALSGEPEGRNLVVSGLP